MKRTTKQLSNPFSTGGGGSNFETRVQAAFTVLLLTGGFAPCLPPWPIVKLKLQGKFAGFDTDDMIVFCKKPNGSQEARLLVQIKHAISITKTNAILSEVTQAAGNDFNGPRLFRAGLDSIALVTGPLSSTDLETRTILEWARHSENARELFRKVNQARFSSKTKRTKLAVLKYHLDRASGGHLDSSGEDLSDDRLWEFMKSYHLLGYDLDIQSGVTSSLLHSLIGQYSADNARAVWTLAIDEVQMANQNAGTVTADSLSDELRGYFEKKVAESIPISLAKKVSPSISIDWSKEPFAAELATATLLGGWSESMSSDTAIVSQVARENFALWIPKLREALQDPKVPLQLRNGVWMVNRKEEIWQTLGPRMFDADLDVFKTAATSVLSERDPYFELPPDDRHMARIQGKVLSHSHALRKGLSDTLALLGSQPEFLTNCSQDKPRTVALLVVREVLNGADWVLWGSLNNLLPLFAEAAPREFLDAVECVIGATPCPFIELFEQEGTGIMGGNYLSGLFWALETLAWDEKHLSRVTVILGELSIIDPGGKWSNRPANSLTTIFLPWLPQTIAPVAKRFVAIQTLRREVPISAWHTLLSLLPGQYQMSSGTYKPVWRQTIPEDWEKEVTRKEYWEQIPSYAGMALEMAGSDPSRLEKLVYFLDSLPPSIFDKLLEHLNSDTVAGLPEADRTRLWSALVDFTTRHRRHSDAEWALGSDLLERIDGVAENLAPKNPLNLHRRLFSGDFDLYEDNRNWQEQEKRLEERRQEAIREIYASGGTEDVIQFACRVDSPAQVGAAFGLIASGEDDVALLPSQLCSEERWLAQFIASYVRKRRWSLGWEWVDKILSKKWTKPQLGDFLRTMPFTSETWARVSLFLEEDESEYWSKVLVNPYQAAGEFDTAVDKLLDHDRPNAAIDCLYAAHHKKSPLDHAHTVGALLAAVATHEEPQPMDIRHAIELIKALQEDAKTDQDDLFKIEWAYLPALDRYSGASPRLLERRLASEPKFFCEVVQVVFRSEKEDTEQREPTEHQKVIAENAYRLLREWRTPPGTLSDGSFAPDNLKIWLEFVESECKESGHLEAALSQIGQVMIHTPPDPTGLWIHKAVAEVLNAKDAEEMRRGFRIGIFNSRGVHHVDPTGAPERELAAKYLQQANEVENCGYHRFAASMRELAETYSRDADLIIAGLYEATNL